ncbi:MAG: hypothetical protein JNL88_07220 [Bacteroidia bacterium]|nr:hypothetical protein [Bacteroidia bacterium]
MRRVLADCLLPLLCAVLLLACLPGSSIFRAWWGEGPPAKGVKADDLRYMYTFGHTIFLEREFLRQPADSPTIYLMGSSELTSGGPYVPYHFISDRFPVKLMGLGHEGNQCFSMYCQLLAQSARLENAPVVIILSPGWFESKPARGTSSAVFLEYNSAHFMRRLLQASVQDEFKAYAYRGMARFYHELNAPEAAYRIAFNRHRSSLSLYHRIWTAPVLKFNTFIDSIRERPAVYGQKIHQEAGGFKVPSLTCSIPWDSLAKVTGDRTRAGATNNPMGIENGYYTRYIHGKKGKIQAVPERYNTELRDFRMLVKLLRSKGARASFIVSPLNPYYFNRLDQLQPAVDTIQAVLKQQQFPVLNLFTSDTTRYDKALLSDVMHLSDYGWLRVNQFIVENYGLCR